MKIILKALSSSAAGIETKLLSEKDMGNYVVRKEIWTHLGNDPTEMEQAYTHDGGYIGNVEDAKRLCDELGIAPEKRTPTSNVVSVGFSKKKGLWFGWSHRAIHGFKIGDKCKEGDCGYTPEQGEWEAKTEADARKMALQFADSVSKHAA